MKPRGIGFGGEWTEQKLDCIRKPLGSIDVSRNATNFLSTLEIQELMKDRKWLGRVTDAIYERHRRRNNSQTQRVDEMAA